jgi:hypothetical protein
MRCLIYFLLLISSTIQAQDSLRLVPVKAWHLSRLIQDAVTLRSCDSLQLYQAKELESQGKLLIAKDKALNLNTSLVNTLEFEVSELRTVIQKTNEATAIKVKSARKRGRIEGGVGVGVIVILTLIFL